jgi:Bacterial regulatory protein, Fis family
VASARCRLGGDTREAALQSCDEELRRRDVAVQRGRFQPHRPPAAGVSGSAFALSSGKLRAHLTQQLLQRPEELPGLSGVGVRHEEYRVIDALSPLPIDGLGPDQQLTTALAARGAEALGMSRATIYRKIKEFGIP